MPQRPRKIPDTPLTNPRSLGGSLVVHGLLLILTSLVALSAVISEDAGRPHVFRARLDTIDNRAPAEPGGGGPGEPGGVGPPIRLDAAGADAAIDDEIAAADRPPEPPQPLDDAPPAPPGGVGTVPGPGRGGGGGTGGGTGGGVGRGVGSTTEFFGLHENAASYAYVIDRSGSMTQQRAFDLAKRELMTSLALLHQESRFAVFFYNHEVMQITGAEGRPGLMPATPANLQRMRARLDRLEATGGTDNVAALRAAFATGAEVIFFLTDARQMTPTDAERLAAEAGSSRILAVMFGVGPAPSASEPLEQLARSTGGDYLYINVLTGPDPGR